LLALPPSWCGSIVLQSFGWCIMLSGLPFFQLWLGTPPMQWSSFLLWTHPENHCTSLKVTAVLPFQALELMHLLNYVHTLVWFINMFVRNKIYALKFVTTVWSDALFGFANRVKKESVSLHLLWRCSLWWCSPSVNYGDNCDDGFHELSRRSCFDLFVPCAFTKAWKLWKGMKHWRGPVVFLQRPTMHKRMGFLVLLPEALLGGHRVGRDLSSLFLEGRKGMRFSWTVILYLLCLVRGYGAG